jgi:uncharacterized SAM-binding protein YcdF (DUF218 family)
MFFALSKILWFLVNPANLILILIVAGTALMWTRWRRFGRTVLTITAFGILAIATLPIGDWMLRPLENRFPAIPTLPERIDGIISVGGAANAVLTMDRKQLSLNDSVERLTEAAAIARRHPEAKLVFTGGSGNLFNQVAKEANVVQPLFETLGVAKNRILLENKSRNTYENAVLTKALVKPQPGEVWVLVTSALHMPRTVGCFRKAGWKVFPYPVDYQFTKNEPFQWSFNLGRGLGRLNGGIHEWLGLIFYRLTDRTNSFFPMPNEA